MPDYKRGSKGAALNNREYETVHGMYIYHVHTIYLWHSRNVPYFKTRHINYLGKFFFYFNHIVPYN